MEAQGRFVGYLKWTAATVLAFLVIVWISATRGNVLVVAAVVAGFYFIAGPAGVYVAIWRNGGKWRDVAGIMLTPLLASLGAFGVPYALLTMYRHSGAGDLIAGAVIAGLGLPLYIFLVWVFVPEDVRELVQRLRSVWTRSCPPRQ
jgi:hypothetical protein